MPDRPSITREQFDAVLPPVDQQAILRCANVPEWSLRLPQMRRKLY